MKKVIYASLLTVGMAGTGTLAEARGPAPDHHHGQGVSHHGPVYGHTSWHHTSTHVSFHHGGYNYHFRYYPRYYRGWSRYCWFPRYRCYGYYSPTDSCWYYWYAPNNCFVPVQYITTFVPTPVPVTTTMPVSPVPGPYAPGMPQLPDGASPVPYGSVPPMP
jgi:hypothetical protein